jgi:hypothetical protein
VQRDFHPSAGKMGRPIHPRFLKDGFNLWALRYRTTRSLHTRKPEYDAVLKNGFVNAKPIARRTPA